MASNTNTSIPLFWESEIKCGRKLGEGTYCVVMAVQDIQLLKEDIVPPFPMIQEDTTTNNNTNNKRQRLAQKFEASRHKKRDLNVAIYGKSVNKNEMDDPNAAPKLAIKKIRPNVSDPQTARDDFQRELSILQTISNHPNIVDLVGIGYSNNDNDDNDDKTNMIPSSLILSQIKSTLAKRLVRWRDEKGIGVYEALSWGIKERKNQWIERLVVLSRLTHAVQHMHSHRILYRDIKPDNVGFDAVTDVPKLLDFGLAKRIIRTDSNCARGNDNSPSEVDDGLFQLTPETGTLRYMAMEVGTEQPYGWTADTYSMGILIHEVLSLKVPFGGMIRSTQFRELVWTQGGQLTLDPTWPAILLELLPRMWLSNPLERPSMEEVAQNVDQMLRGTDEDLFPTTLLPAPPGRSFWGVSS